MKSLIKVSRGGRSITFRGGAARAAFEAMTGTKLPPKEEQIRAEHAQIAAHNEGQRGMPQGPCQCPVCKPEA